MKLVISLKDFTKKPYEIFSEDRFLFIGDNEALFFDDVNSESPIHVLITETDKVLLKCNKEEIGFVTFGSLSLDLKRKINTLEFNKTLKPRFYSGCVSFLLTFFLFIPSGFEASLFLGSIAF